METLWDEEQLLSQFFSLPPLSSLSHKLLSTPFCYAREVFKALLSCLYSRGHATKFQNPSKNNSNMSPILDWPRKSNYRPSNLDPMHWIMLRIPWNMPHHSRLWLWSSDQACMTVCAIQSCAALWTVTGEGKQCLHTWSFGPGLAAHVRHLGLGYVHGQAWPTPCQATLFSFLG